MPLKPPEDLLPFLEGILRYSQESLNKLLTALKEAQPTLHLEDLASSVSAKTGLKVNEATGVIRVLITLYSTYEEEGADVESFLDEEVLPSLRQLAKPVTSLEQLNRVKQFFQEALALENVIGTASKAFDVLTERERLFFGARILTDLRPIFKTDIREHPSTAVIVHSLKIHYSDNGGHSNAYFALDILDLRELQRIIERAIVKENTLRESAKEAGIQCLTFGIDEES